MAVNQNYALFQSVLGMLFAIYCENRIIRGLRFSPTEEELMYGIFCKINGLALPFGGRVQENDVYAYSPLQLSRMYNLDVNGDNIYFMTPRRRSQSEQFVRDVGFWKPMRNGRELELKSAGGRSIGSMRIHYFFKKYDDEKHEWVMKEYIRKASDDWVIVKILRTNI